MDYYAFTVRYKKFTFPLRFLVFTPASFYAILCRSYGEKEALTIKSYDFDPDERQDTPDPAMPQVLQMPVAVSTS